METGSDSGGRRRANTGTKSKDVRISRGSSRTPATNGDDDSSDRRISGTGSYFRRNLISAEVRQIFTSRLLGGI